MSTSTHTRHLHRPRATSNPARAAVGEAWSPWSVLAVLLLAFGLLGVVIGSQAVLWAELIPLFGISSGLFGSAQVASPLVSIALLLVGGQLSSRVGKQRLGLASVACLGASAVALGAGGGLPSLVLALVLLGTGNGLFETSMNGAALDWEQATGRQALNVLHAGFSSGAVAGAIGAGWLLSHRLSPADVLHVLALLSMVVFVAMLLVRFPGVPSEASDARGALATVRLVLGRRRLAFLAVLCVLGAVGESVANLWSVVYLYQRGGGALLGGATFALLSGGMLIGRLMNAWIVGRLGAQVSLRASAIGLMLAAALLVLPGGLGLAIAGLGLLGLAVAGIVPTVLGAAARVAPGHSGAIAGGMLAAVYLSFLLCPPLIGWLAELSSLQAALLLVGLSGAGILWLVHRVPIH